MANIHRDPARVPTPFSPEDFTPGPKADRYLTEEESEAALVRMTQVFGGADKREIQDGQ